MRTEKLVLGCFLGVLPALVSCRKCEDLGERNFGLVFYHDGQPAQVQFSEVKGLGGNGSISNSGANSQYRLPVSLHQDSSTFVFYPNGGQPDTLTLTYKRNFFYQDKLCGFRVKFSDFKSGKSTTFPDVAIVDIEYAPGFFFSFPNEIYEVRIYR